MAKIKRYTNGLWEEVTFVPEISGVVKTTLQELAESEQIQARSNIGAASIEDVNNLRTEVVTSSEYNFEVANNTEYHIEYASGLLMTGNNNKAHGFITFGDRVADVIQVLGFKASAGDDITQASAGETWEFSCDYGYIVWKNWGA